MRMIVALLAVGFLTAAHAQTKPQNWDARLALTRASYPYLKAGGEFLSFNIFNGTYTANAYSAEMLYRISKSKLRIGLAATHIKIEQYYVPIFDFGWVDNLSVWWNQKN